MKQYQEEIIALENEELKSLTPDITLYVKLMAYYLVQNNLNDVKFLWSRIPSSLKSDTQLQQLNVLQQALTTSNLTLFFGSISKNDWSDDIKTVIEDLKKHTRIKGLKDIRLLDLKKFFFNIKIKKLWEKVLQLISNAYTSILKKHLIELTNLNEDELKQVCLEREWTFESDGEQLVIHPKRPMFNTYSTSESEYQLSKLTEFVSFLEN